MGSFHCFYQECWEIIKDDLLEVFNEFYESSTINKCINATFIVLGPKKDNICDFSDFQPISLVSSMYKIIANVLSMRLRNVMGDLVSNS